MKKILFLLMLSLSLILVGCSSGSDSEESNNTITIGYNNFAETIAEVNVWKLILEKEGYDVELKQTEKGPLFTALAGGEVDVNVEVWLPHTDKDYVEEYEEDIVQHDAWYEDTTMGIAVPEYVDIDSIDELNEYTEELDEQIIGIEPGASIMKTTENALEEYKLDLDLVESSDAAMSAELEDYYQNEEPVAVTLWEPHWIFAENDMKFLEDPKNVYGEPDKMYWYSRQGFEEDFPEVTKWFDQWEMSHDELSDLMNVLKDYDRDPEKGAQEWLDDNQDLVEEWIH
ncbi:MAG TPA: glycine betaine ABC transporter substrate-binding protein [Pseudogracilibacillus sp.]|nr:glycine betaine ABC transporter substrate-binding protein [Pseudogracilibacillus sp.]